MKLFNFNSICLRRSSMTIGSWNFMKSCFKLFLILLFYSFHSFFFFFLKKIEKIWTSKEEILWLSRSFSPWNFSNFLFNSSSSTSSSDFAFSNSSFDASVSFLFFPSCSNCVSFSLYFWRASAIWDSNSCCSLWAWFFSAKYFCCHSSASFFNLSTFSTLGVLTRFIVDPILLNALSCSFYLFIYQYQFKK